MVKEYFHQVSSTFEAAQCISFPILFAPIISQNCRHYKASRLLSSINAISSPSCVFKLQIPIVLHCLISPIKNWDVWSFFYRVNNPRIIQPFTSEDPKQGGAYIFTNIFCYQSSSVNILYLLNFYDKNKKYVRLFVISRLF